jgi:hypothetical protein
MVLATGLFLFMPEVQTKGFGTSESDITALEETNASTNGAKEQSTPVRVAVCLAGRFHNPQVNPGEATFKQSYRTIEPLLVNSLQADVYAVSDDQFIPSTETLGPRFRAGEHLPQGISKGRHNLTSIVFPEIEAARVAGQKDLPYLLKIWRCGQLIHRSGVRYDVVVRMRPDLMLYEEFKVSRTNVPGIFELQVGPSRMRFGQRDIVMNAFTTSCFSDVLQIGTLSSMTVMMDMVRHVAPHSRFLSTDEATDEMFMQVKGEMLWPIYAWRTGTRLLRVPLWFELMSFLEGFPYLNAKDLLGPAYNMTAEECIQGKSFQCIRLSEWALVEGWRTGCMKECFSEKHRSAIPFSGDCAYCEGQQKAKQRRIWVDIGKRANASTCYVAPDYIGGTIITARARKDAGLLAGQSERPTCGNVKDLRQGNALLPCAPLDGDMNSHTIQVGHYGEAAIHPDAKSTRQTWVVPPAHPQSQTAEPAQITSGS